jgi:hypothetical protein
MEEKLVKIIYDWVKNNFGESEADDPSWNIEDLAKEIAKHQHEFYWQRELEYLEEDVRNYVEGLDAYDKRLLFGGLDNHEWKLTEQQVYNVADEIRNSEWYCSIDPIMLREYIRRELEIAKEKGE